MVKTTRIIVLIILMAGLVSETHSEGLINPDKDITLSNGLRVILIKDTRLPMVYLSLLIRAGSGADSPEVSGRAELTGIMLKAGSENYSAEEMAGAVDSVGGTLEIHVDRDYTTINADFLARDFDLAADILSDMVINPVFDEGMLDQAVRRQKSVLLQMRSLPDQIVMTEVYRRFYRGSGYGLPTAGTIDGIEGMSIEDIRRFHKKYYNAKNAALVVIGDFKSDEAVRVLERSFRSWSPGERIEFPEAEVSLPDTTRIYLIDNPSAANTQFAIGHPAVPIGAGDFPNLAILSYLLGGGGEVSRLQRSLVEERNLALNIHSALIWSRNPGMVMVTGSAMHSMTAEVISESLAIIERMRSLKIPANEIRETSSFFNGYLPMYLETAAGRASGIDELLGFDVGLGYFDKLLQTMEKANPSSLRKTAQKYLVPNEMIIVVSGPADRLKAGLNQIGPVEIIEVDSD